MARNFSEAFAQYTDLTVEMRKAYEKLTTIENQLISAADEYQRIVDVYGPLKTQIKDEALLDPTGPWAELKKLMDQSASEFVADRAELLAKKQGFDNA